MASIKIPINPNKSRVFVCKMCDYITNNKKDYLKHTYTRKHVRLTVDLPQHVSTNCVCNCGKIYIHKQSLYKHKQKCVYNEHTPNNITIVFDQDEILEEPQPNEDQEVNNTFIPNNNLEQIHNNEIYKMMQQVLEQQQFTQQQQQTILEQQSQLNR